MSSDSVPASDRSAIFTAVTFPLNDPPVPVGDDYAVCDEWKRNIATVLLSERAIQRKVLELGNAVSEYYRQKLSKPLLVVGLLTGAFVFVADLLRTLGIPYEVDFMTLSSYGRGTTSSGSVRLVKDMSIDPHDRDVLIVEDLIDTGTTLQWLGIHLDTKGTRSVRVCCLLDKRIKRKANVFIDFAGFVCPDEFVIGYGMDFADEYRCLPFIGVLKPEAYQH